MQKSTTYLIVGVLIAVIGIAAGAAFYLNAPATTPGVEYVKIGTHLPLTGPNSDIGWLIAHAIQMAADDINAQGGLTVGGKNYKVQIILGDDESKVEVGVAVAEKLMTVDNVDVMVGDFHSSIALACMTSYQQHKVPAIIVCAGTHTIVERIAAEGLDYVFDLSPTIKEMADSACNSTYYYRHPKKIAFLNENTDSGRSLSLWCRKWFNESAPEVEVVMDDFYAAGTTEYYAELSKLKTSGADAWFGEVFGAGAAAFWNQYSEIEVPVFPVDVGGAWTSTVQNIQAYQHQLNGMFVLQRYWGTHFTNLTMPFYANFKGRYGTEASPYSIQGYDGVLMAANAIELAGSLDKAKIKDALANEKNVLTVWGYRSFSSLATGHAMPVEMAMIQIVNGNRYPIWPLALAKSANVTYTSTYPPYPWST